METGLRREASQPHQEEQYVNTQAITAHIDEDCFVDHVFFKRYCRYMQLRATVYWLPDASDTFAFVLEWLEQHCERSPTSHFQVDLLRSFSIWSFLVGDVRLLNKMVGADGSIVSFTVT